MLKRKRKILHRIVTLQPAVSVKLAIMSDDTKPSLPQATRRDVLRGMGAVAGASANPGAVAVAGQSALAAVEYVPMVTPLATVVKFLEMTDVLLRDKMEGLFVAAALQPNAKKTYVSKRAGQAFARDLLKRYPPKIQARIHSVTPAATPYMNIISDSFELVSIGPHWKYIARSIKSLGEGRGDQADWDTLFHLVKSDLIDEGSPYLLNEYSVVRKEFPFEYRLGTYIDKYRKSYDQLRELEAMIRADPQGYKKILAEMNDALPEFFPATGDCSIEQGVKLLKQVQDGTLEVTTPEALQDTLRECWGRMTGRIPEGLSYEAQARLEKLYRTPGYQPFLSRKAQLVRIKTHAKESLKQAEFTVTRGYEELPVFLHDEYKKPAMMHRAPVYYVSMAGNDQGTNEENENRFSLHDLEKIVRARFPYQPLITESFRYDEHPYYYDYKNQRLRFVDPDPKLVKWLDSLTKPDTKVTAIERLRPPQRMLEKYYR